MFNVDITSSVCYLSKILTPSTCNKKLCYRASTGIIAFRVSRPRYLSVRQDMENHGKQKYVPMQTSLYCNQHKHCLVV